MGIRSFFRQFIQIEKEIREENFHKDLNKVHQFIQTLTNSEKEELLASLLIVGVEYEGGAIDEYLEELEKNVLIKRKKRKSEEI